MAMLVPWRCQRMGQADTEENDALGERQASGISLALLCSSGTAYVDPETWRTAVDVVTAVRYVLARNLANVSVMGFFPSWEEFAFDRTLRYLAYTGKYSSSGR